MFRYKLRTLMIVLAIGPPVLAAAWPFVRTWVPQRDVVDLDKFRKPFSGAIELYDPRAELTD